VADGVFDVHGFATLLGYGADAICPRLALATVAAEADSADDGDLTSPEAQRNLQAAVEAGVLKILSKMGISTVDSYRGAQIFEVIGLDAEAVALSLRGPAAPARGGRVGGGPLGEDVLRLMEEADVAWSGFYRVRKRGEYHAHSDEVVSALNALTLVKEDAERDPAIADMTAAHVLQRAIAGDSWELYEQFRALVDDRPATELHDLLAWV